MKKIILSILLLVSVTTASYSQNLGALSPWATPTFLTANGTAPLALGFVCTFAAGTSDPLVTYQDNALTTENQNPIRLTISGRPVNGATEVSIYLAAASYKFALYTAGTGNTCNGTAVGSLVKTVDNIYDLAQLFTLNFATKVLDKVCHASQYTGTTPNDAGGKIAYCINSVLPSTGGTVDARGLEGAQAWSSDPFTSVTKPVTILLGASTITLSNAVTVPVNVNLVHQQGSIFQVNNGVTLNIRGSVDAGLYRIYTWSGTGAIKFAPTGQGSRNSLVYVEWFGATDSGISTNDASYIQKAFDSVQNSSEGVEMAVKFRKAQYCVGAALTAESIKIYGEGEGTQLITNQSGCADMGAAVFLTMDADEREGAEIVGITVKGTSTQNGGILLQTAHYWAIRRVHSTGFTKSNAYAIRVEASFTGQISDTVVENSDRGVEVVRVGEGSGGVSLIDLRSGGLITFGITVEDSTGVGCYNCELNVYGSGAVRGTGVRVIASASNVAEAFTFNGGYIVSGRYGFELGGAGLLNFNGIHISGVSIDGCTTPLCSLAANADSAAVFVTVGTARGIHLSGNTAEGYGSWLRTSAALPAGVLEMTANVIGDNGLIAPSAFININGTELTDTDAAAIDGQSFSVGTCQGLVATGADNPAKCGYASMRLYSSTTLVGNIGAGEDTLMTYTLPAGMLSTLGRGVRVTAFGNTAANANNKTVKCYFGSAAIFNQGPTAANSQHWTASFTIISGPSSNVQQYVEGMTSWNGAVLVPTRGQTTENTGNAIVIRCTSESAAAATDDAQQRGMIIEFLP